MTGDTDGAVAGQDGMLEPTDVAKCVVKAIQVRHLRVQSHLNRIGNEPMCPRPLLTQNGEFLILPHPQVQKYHERKASNFDRWIKGMQRLHNSYVAELADVPAHT
mmetsp:Transcript_3/g.12  ORF Transcript_3/g.12 Transcript_3/m.12 type:complete len:105 (-) Transcript_3:170-484(-)